MPDNVWTKAGVGRNPGPKESLCSCKFRTELLLKRKCLIVHVDFCKSIEPEWRNYVLYECKWEIPGNSGLDPLVLLLSGPAGVDVPADRIIDGKNVLALMTGQTTVPLVAARYYYYDTHLQAVRSGNWKLILLRLKCPPWLSDKGLAKNWRGRDVEEIPGAQLYNVRHDIGQTTDVADQHPEIVERLLGLAEMARADIGDYNRIGENARFFDSQPARPDAAEWKGR
jgi:hypothetical protein